MKIAVLGASGLLGSALVPKLRRCDHKVTTIGRSPGSSYVCNIGDENDVAGVLSALMPDVIINLVALTDVDMCEIKPNFAFKINVSALENVVSWIEQSQHQCHLVQLSTDQVYDGFGVNSETDVVLSNYYAFSKYTAELVALRVRSTILRTNFFGKSHCKGRQSFTDWLHTKFVNKEAFFLFNDVYFSPLSLETLCEILSRLVLLQLDGIYNLGSRGGLSKSDFALQFASNLNLNVGKAMVTSIESVDFMDTYRPKDMRLNVSKIESKMNLVLPTLKDELDKVTGDYNATT